MTVTKQKTQHVKTRAARNGKKVQRFVSHTGWKSCHFLLLSAQHQLKQQDHPANMSHGVSMLSPVPNYTASWVTEWTHLVDQPGAYQLQFWHHNHYITMPRATLYNDPTINNHVTSTEAVTQSRHSCLTSNKASSELCIQSKCFSMSLKLEVTLSTETLAVVDFRRSKRLLALRSSWWLPLALAKISTPSSAISMCGLNTHWYTALKYLNKQHVLQSVENFQNDESLNDTRRVLSFFVG